MTDELFLALLRGLEAFARAAAPAVAAAWAVQAGPAAVEPFPGGDVAAGARSRDERRERATPAPADVEVISKEGAFSADAAAVNQFLQEEPSARAWLRLVIETDARSPLPAPLVELAYFAAAVDVIRAHRDGRAMLRAVVTRAEHQHRVDGGVSSASAPGADRRVQAPTEIAAKQARQHAELRAWIRKNVPPHVLLAYDRLQAWVAAQHGPSELAVEQARQHAELRDWLRKNVPQHVRIADYRVQPPPVAQPVTSTPAEKQARQYAEFRAWIRKNVPSHVRLAYDQLQARVAAGTTETPTDAAPEASVPPAATGGTSHPARSRQSRYRASAVSRPCYLPWRALGTSRRHQPSRRVPALRAEHGRAMPDATDGRSYNECPDQRALTPPRSADVEATPNGLASTSGAATVDQVVDADPPARAGLRLRIETPANAPVPAPRANLGYFASTLEVIREPPQGGARPGFVAGRAERRDDAGTPTTREPAPHPTPAGRGLTGEEDIPAAGRAISPAILLAEHAPPTGPASRALDAPVHREDVALGLSSVSWNTRSSRSWPTTHRLRATRVEAAWIFCCGRLSVAGSHRGPGRPRSEVLQPFCRAGPPEQPEQRRVYHCDRPRFLVVDRRDG